ncbi:uncharacterized protein K02A2.6-like [Pectinophora gossypiella]|uniref:uncharacterized protein K02A2.6-like n=1 Tax=Pectinophora gossypiella TaxID=13191 RepID=UPI00214EB9B9|nr:uncharacterized protein K02A2.6-like [Pectinophora gossypiella]
MGIVKMKSIARSVMWWPGIDADIERTCRECGACAAEAAAPARASPQPWPYVTEPWSRLHVDFLGPFHGKTFFVLIDSTSKWLEVFLMPRTTASAVIKVLRETFARFGLPKEVVSDNGPPFSSKEYVDFMNTNGIKLTYSPIYHPSSNGAAEGAVKLCKRVLKKAMRERMDIDMALQAYLMAYRNVEHATTGVSPAVLLQRRTLRSRLDLLRGERQVENRVQQAQRKQIEYSGGTDRRFQVGEPVLARDYTGGKKWMPGRIEGTIGSRAYVIGQEHGPPIKRHVDQLKRNWSALWPTRDAAPEELVASDGSNANPAPEPSGPASATQEMPPLSTQGSQISRAPTAPPLAPSLPILRPRDKLRPVQRYGFEID